LEADVTATAPACEHGCDEHAHARLLAPARTSRRTGRISPASTGADAVNGFESHADLAADGATPATADEGRGSRAASERLPAAGRTLPPAATATDDMAGKAQRSSVAETGGAARVRERRRRLALELLAVCALVLVVWTVLLGVTLPSDYRVHAWRTTWVGFDFMLLVSLTTTVVLTWRRSRAAIIPGLATAVLLICDAWFDISLDLGTSGAWQSVASAVLIEVPLAILIFHRAYAAFTRGETTPNSKRSWFN
jgi:hypothetical protein